MLRPTNCGLFCCFNIVLGKGSRVLKTSGSDNDTSALLAQSQKFDLLANEGSNLQNDLWELCFRAKVQASRTQDYQLYQRLSHAFSKGTVDASLQVLSNLYEQHGLGQYIPRIRSVFQTIAPFNNAINNFVQGGPQVASLVWGSVQVVFQAVLRVVEVFDDIVHVLDELSTALPRFAAYMDVLKTPRLHNTLRDIYDLYISFYIDLAQFLERGQCLTAIRLQLSSVDQRLRETKIALQKASRNFESEAGLASTQIDVERHDMVIETLQTINSNDNSEPLTKGLIARNVLFTGRDDIFDRIRGMLENYDNSMGNTSCKSCVIHGLGGLGKSEIALEYTHRFHHHYKYIFWVRAESESVLADSFLNILSTAQIEAGSTILNKKIEMCWGWLETTAGQKGSIIITTQNPDLVDIATSDIKLPPMTDDEGSELIRRYLQRGGSEQETAKRLSHTLGGLPLAIAHFSGYVAKSQCTLDQILASYESRANSSRIWSVTDLAAVSGYSQTLESVWSLALQRLSSDAKELLNIMAFLEADRIPEEMFLGPQQTGSDIESPVDGEYWNIHRFNEAIRILRDQHLVERHLRGDAGEFLTTHRALQRHLLHLLDKDLPERSEIFQKALKFIRKCFPHYNIVLRGDTSNFQTNKKYLPHVASIHTVWKQSDSKMPPDFTLAELLRDAAAFLVNWQVREEALPILATAEKISKAIYMEKPSVAGRLLASVTSDLGIYDQYLRIETRQRGIARTARAIELRKEQLDSLSVMERERSDIIFYARFLVDHGCCLLQVNAISEANSFFYASLKEYKRGGTEETIKARFGIIYTLQSITQTALKNVEEAEILARKGLLLMEQALGNDAHTTIWCKFLVSNVFFNIGKIDMALKLHSEVLESRVRDLGEEHHETLSSKYCLGVVHEQMGALEDAEELLRDVCKHTDTTLQWRMEDVARASFRLSLLLQKQKKHREAAHYQNTALDLRKQYTLKLSCEPFRPSMNDEAVMAWFDSAVCAWHGRTAGLWRAGDYW